MYLLKLLYSTYARVVLQIRSDRKKARSGIAIAPVFQGHTWAFLGHLGADGCCQWVITTPYGVLRRDALVPSYFITPYGVHTDGWIASVSCLAAYQYLGTSIPYYYSVVYSTTCAGVAGVAGALSCRTADPKHSACSKSRTARRDSIAMANLFILSSFPRVDDRHLP